MIEKERIIKDPKEFKIFICILSKISSNHHREIGFINAINHIILNYKDQIQNAFSNLLIFKLFKDNKLIILFLLKQKIITFNQEIVDYIIQKDSNGTRYFDFFYPEIQEILKSLKKINVKNEIKFEINSQDFNHFEEKREKGENDSYLCELIRNDSIIEFVSYTTKENISLAKSRIKKSIFETNSFLLNLSDEPYLIEYAAFYGSIQIIKYLCFNKVEIRPIIWLHAIHSNNAELIHFLEEIHIDPPNNSYSIVLSEAIKCHHNDIAKYIHENLLDKSQTDKTDEYSIYNNYVINEILSFNYSMYTNEFKEYDELYYLFKVNGKNIGESYIQMKVANNESIIPEKKVYQNCKELTGVIISPYETKIDDYAFNQCRNLKEIIFLKNSSVKYIGKKAFCGCTSLKKIELPITVSFIGENAFEYCDNVHLKVSPPLFSKKVDYCIYNNIRSIEMINYLSFIPECAFRRCVYLSKIIIPSSVTIIKNFAFKECLFLSSITLPEKVGIIGIGAFEKCYNLEKVILVNPSTLKKIDNYAFKGCTVLNEINYTPLVTLGRGVFDNCPYMTKKLNLH